MVTLTYVGPLWLQSKQYLFCCWDASSRNVFKFFSSCFFREVAIVVHCTFSSRLTKTHTLDINLSLTDSSKPTESSDSWKKLNESVDEKVCADKATSMIRKEKLFSWQDRIGIDSLNVGFNNINRFHHILFWRFYLCVSFIDKDYRYSDAWKFGIKFICQPSYAEHVNWFSIVRIF